MVNDSDLGRCQPWVYYTVGVFRFVSFRLFISRNLTMSNPESHSQIPADPTLCSASMRPLPSISTITSSVPYAHVYTQNSQHAASPSFYPYSVPSNTQSFEYHNPHTPTTTVMPHAPQSLSYSADISPSSYHLSRSSPLPSKSNQVSTAVQPLPKAPPPAVKPIASPLVAVKSGPWSVDERDLLLAWLGGNLSNYEEFKMKLKSTCLKLSSETFSGSRTADGIKGQWDQMKKKYSKAKERLQSTGEGQRDDVEKWSSIKLSWLDKMCPHYEQIDDILKRDKSITPLFVSEVGGDTVVEFINGERQQEEEEEEEDNNVDLDWTPTDDEDSDVHPPAGGQKIPKPKSTPSNIPIKKGESKGVGAKGLKKRKHSAAEDAMEGIQEKRIRFEKKRLQYERERDDKNFRFLRKKEDNRHEESLLRFRLLEKKIELQLASMPVRSEKAHEELE